MPLISVGGGAGFDPDVPYGYVTLQSPDGTLYRLSVDDGGNPQTDALTLSSLVDVTVTDPQDGDTLTFDDGIWENQL